MTFLFPFGALFVIACGAVLLFAMRLRHKAVEGVLQSFRLHVSYSNLRWEAAATVILIVFLAVAASRPALTLEESMTVRTDAAVIFVFDVSGSMLAQESPQAHTRLERAKIITADIAQRFPEISFGIAVFTSNAYSHLPPLHDKPLFERALEDVVDIGSVPTKPSQETVTTDLAAIRQLAVSDFFPDVAEKKIVVLFTDGETSASFYELRQAVESITRNGIALIIVGVGKENERVFVRNERMQIVYGRDGKAIAASHLPKPNFAMLRDVIAPLAGGEFVAERDRDELRAAIREELGSGDTAVIGSRTILIDVSRFFLAAALVPFMFLLIKRL